MTSIKRLACDVHMEIQLIGCCAISTIIELISQFIQIHRATLFLIVILSCRVKEVFLAMLVLLDQGVLTVNWDYLEQKESPELRLDILLFY